MAFEKILDMLAYIEPRPNKFTIYLGNQIQKARMEAGLSQEELSNFLQKRRATVSDIENGKGEVDASTLAILAHVLEKPLGYFYPTYLYQEIKQEDLSYLENELLIYFRQIVDDTLQEVVIKQIKVMSEFDPKDLVLNLAPEIAARLENEDELLYFLSNRSKGKNSNIR
jgi:transcriptional regulator with XRE-family HTH domain